ncbi:unnamed protein product [Blepharisma stoltei]|uniref:Purple acid phosphatase n=1 Tax=Blepharisma stoltei TaxID=1481888 RepID=A0AAU9JYA9_9CILI|nr:unnamed protein product [Blepharisma stoltei]
MHLLILLIAQASISLGLIHPEQIHLSWTSEPNQIRVTWVTYLSAFPKAYYRPILCGNVPSPSNFTAVAAQSTKFLQGNTTHNHYQFIHTALFTDLIPACWYEYQVSNTGVKSKTYIFSGRTPDNSTTFYDVDNAISMVILGDWGSGHIGHFTKYLLEEESKSRNYLGILHMGDIAYDLDTDNGKIGDDYLNMVEPIVASFPYMVEPGNHESFNNYSHYKSRFNMPHNGDNQGTGYFYSLNLGPVHFVLINSNSYFHSSYQTEAEVQTQWLSNDLALANQNREIRPWIVVLMHHPLYCSQQLNDSSIMDNCANQPAVIRPILEDIFYNNSVDLVLQGHVHNYERDAAIYKNLTVNSEFDSQNMHVNANAPIYIESGGAGNYEKNNPVSNTPAPYARYLSSDYGYGRLTAFNTTHMYWEQFSSQALTEIDCVWIIKDRPRY